MSLGFLFGRFVRRVVGVLVVVYDCSCPYYLGLFQEINGFRFRFIKQNVDILVLPIYVFFEISHQIVNYSEK